MSFNPKTNRRPFTRAAFAALVIPLFAVAGCGTDDDTLVKKTTPTTTVATTEPTPAPTPVESATPPATPAPVQEVTYEFAENAFLNARYDEAVALFTRYTERESNNPWGYYMLGLSAWKDGRLDVAESAFQQSLTLDPSHLKSCLNLARVLLDSHRAYEALPVLDRALAIDSTASAAHRLKGRAYHDLNRTDEAVLAYQAAIRLDPADAWSMNNLAFIRIQQGRFEDALPALARAVELRKDVPVFYNNLGMALEHTGHFAAASEAYAFAVSLDASNEKATLNHDRVAAVRDDPSLPPVDLTALARGFESTIETWTVTTVSSAPADSMLSVQPR
jgi:Flp pilus assembly protein TadD